MGLFGIPMEVECEDLKQRKEYMNNAFGVYIFAFVLGALIAAEAF